MSAVAAVSGRGVAFTGYEVSSSFSLLHEFASYPKLSWRAKSSIKTQIWNHSRTKRGGWGTQLRKLVVVFLRT